MFAHPDDEVIFGWPLLQVGRMGWLLVVSNDLLHPTRRSTAHRKYVLQALCRHWRVPMTCLDWPSEFSRLNERDGTRAAFCQDLLARLIHHDCDSIFTHNPVGEYGHEDHKLVFDVACHAGKRLIYTDISLKTDWTGLEGIPPVVRKAWYADKLGDYKLDGAFYQCAENIYRRGRAWTWNQPPVKNCALFTVTP